MRTFCLNLFSGLLAIILVTPVVMANSSPIFKLPSEVKIFPNGSFRLKDARFLIQCHSANWKPTFNWDWKIIHSQLTDSIFDLEAEMPVEDADGQVTETIRPYGANGFRLRCDVRFKPPLKVNALHGLLQIPARKGEIAVDGQTVNLPNNFREMIIFSNQAVREVRIPLSAAKTLVVTADQPFRLTVRERSRSRKRNRNRKTRTARPCFPHVSYLMLPVI